MVECNYAYGHDDGYKRGWKAALEAAARIAEDPKWTADPRAVSCDQPRSIALQIRELMK